MNARRLLAIESSCDETAAAVISEQGDVLSNVIASQFELHQEFGGVVPEIASRAHVARILPTIRTALAESNTKVTELAAVAVTSEPGLVGSLLVGLTAAKTIALSLGVPLVTVNHVDAHIFACGIGKETSIFPCVGFVVSGGHTNLYDCRSATDFSLIGSTTDDAVGEAFDKVARILGLPYPGGPSIEQAARSGDPRVWQMPRPMLKKPGLEFSFSGLKTAALYAARGVPGPDQLTTTPPERVADLAASFQEAAVDVLTVKARRALDKTGHPRLCVGGGVAANQRLRQSLAAMCCEARVELCIADMEYCTDNAAMAAIAWEHLSDGNIAQLDADVLPGLIRHGALQKS
ncbi:MAG: tRNA (adenosine(37)-N6)-threonylcarbamoyltransferase complex transferase subunit TsaD [Fuerstiella sp.]|nr:tRNA (adenosine(37)-N6)-threonylcarbamoyltransferase complex transferase subunit TsaD [Fuerstiella sp.]